MRDRLGHQATDVRRRDDIGHKRGDDRGDGIWSGARPTSIAQPAIPVPSSQLEPSRAPLIDEIAARDVDQIRRSASSSCFPGARSAGSRSPRSPSARHDHVSRPSARSVP